MDTIPTIVYLITRIYNLKQAVQKRVIIALIHMCQAHITPVMVAINLANAHPTIADHIAYTNV
jgi:hypothetical protein